MAIPPGPQLPFEKTSLYGQKPGFISRHSTKIYVLVAIVAIALVVWFFVVLMPNDATK